MVQETYPSHGGTSTESVQENVLGCDPIGVRSDQVVLASARPSVKSCPAMALIEVEEAARRLARAIASDLSLYNAEKIERGIANDNLFDELAADIEEGRALYNSRVSPELYNRNFYDRAIVDLLIRGKGHIRSKMW